MRRERARWGLLPTVCIVVTLTSILTTAVVPLLPIISHQLGVGPAEVSWVLTANLLAAAVGTPVLSRLADRRDPKKVLMAIMVMVAVGTALCAVWESFVPLIIGRTLQGFSFASFPICVALLRALLDAAHLTRSIGVMSALLALGGGAGVVLAGLLQFGNPDYRVVFGALFAASIPSLLLTWTVIPSVRRDRSPLGLDPAGQLIMAASLAALLLWLSRGEQMGWESAGSVALVVTGVVLFAAFLWRSAHTRDPLVPPGLLVASPISFVHLAALLVGLTMYVQFLGVTLFVQTDPDVAGYGFGASVLRAGVVYLLPGLLAGGVVSVTSSYFVNRFGATRFFGVVCAVGAAGFLWLLLWRDQTWQVILGVIMLNVYVSAAYAALPSLIVADVREKDTGLANGINAVARTVGSSVGSALLGTVFAALLIEGTTVPQDVAYDLMFGAAIIGVMLAAGAVAVSARRRTVTPRESVDA